MADRFDFFFRQKVTEAELDGAFDALEAADRNLSIDLDLIGVVQNAQVTEKSGTPDLTVDIAGSSVVYDKLGQRIAWGAAQNVDVSVDENSVSTTVSTPGNEKIVSVFAVFERVLTDPRVDGNSLTVYFDVAEGFSFAVRQGAESPPPATPPALDVEEILLADITRTNGQTQIFNADIDLTDRREDAFKLTTASLDVRAGTPEEAAQGILQELENHVAGVSNIHPASAIDYGGGPAWHDGTTNPAATAEAQFDKLITDLVASAGLDRIGGAAYTGALLDLSAGSGQDQLREIADTTNVKALDILPGGAFTVNTSDVLINEFQATFANVPVQIGDEFGVSGALTPAALAASQNNYNPTGWADAFVVRLTPAAGGSTITGFVGSSNRFRVLVNLSASDVIVLTHDSASSTAANRIYCPGATDYVIPPRGMAVAFYDGTLGRWVLQTPPGTLTFWDVISPAALGATEDNWAPTGFAQAMTIRITPDGTGTAISGIAGGVEGMTKLLVNLDTVNSLSLLHESASSTAANRIYCPGGSAYNFSLPGAVLITYDATSSRWRVHG